MSDQPQRRDRGGMLAVVRGQLPEDLSQLRDSLVSLLVRITFPHLTTTCAPTDGLPLHRLAPHGDALEKPSGGNGRCTLGATLSLPRERRVIDPDAVAGDATNSAAMSSRSQHPVPVASC